MQTREALALPLKTADFIVQGYLADLDDSELLIRPVPGSNHIAWQIGHLIVSERSFGEGIKPGSMPPLPEGFEEKYSAANSKLDSPGAFHPKSVYMKLAAEQRAGLIKLLETLPEAEFDAPPPESFRAYTANVADMFSMAGCHWLMHVGQWAIVRRKQGRPPLF